MGTVGGNLCLDTRCIFYNQSEWWRGANQSLPQDHRRDLPRRAEEPRRLLRDLQRRSRAGAADARRRGRHRRAGRAPHAAARQALHRLRAAGSAGHRDARRRQVLPLAAAGRIRHRGAREEHARPALRPTTRSASAARSNIRSAASRWRCAATATRSPTCASPSPAPIRARCCSRAPTSSAAAPLDARVFKGLDDLVRDQIMAMKTTFTPGHYRRRVAGVLARRLVQRLWDLPA